MECVSNMVKVSLPNYLSSLPIPSSIGGWFSLSLSDWARLVPFGVTVTGLSYLGLQGLANISPPIRKQLGSLPGFKEPRCNNKVKMCESKVVDAVDMEDLGDKAVFCRCWKSEKFPYCDGSHAKHNKATGDNVGPLIVKKAA